MAGTRPSSFTRREHQGQRGAAAVNPTVPLASWRGGDFSALAPGTNSQGSIQRRRSLPGQTLSRRAGFNPVSIAIQKTFWPLPNFRQYVCATESEFPSERSRVPTTPAPSPRSGSINRFNERFTVFARYNWARSYGRPYDGNLPGTIGQAYGRRQNNGGNLSATLCSSAPTW